MSNMKFSGPNIRERVEWAAETVTDHALAAAEAGLLTLGRRVLLGEQAVHDFINAEVSTEGDRSGIELHPGGYIAMTTSIIVSLLHLAHGHHTPAELRELADRQLTTEANPTRVWMAQGPPSTGALTASALASLLAYLQALRANPDQAYGYALTLWEDARVDGRDPHHVDLRTKLAQQMTAAEARKAAAGRADRVEIIAEPSEYETVLLTFFVNGSEMSDLPEHINVVAIGTENPDLDWREEMELEARAASTAAGDHIRQRVRDWM